MSKLPTKFNYKEMYAIKHALQLNIKYKDLGLVGAVGEEKEKLIKDIEFETKLLEKVTNDIESFKKRNNI